MYRFTLRQLFAATALVGIFLALIRSDGCGVHESFVGSVEFSADSKRIAVARYDARNANTPMKHYLENVSRTISIIGVLSLRSKTVVQQDLRRGNQGPAFKLFRHAGNSIAFTSEHDLTVMEFGGGAVWNYDLAIPKSKPRPLIDQSEYVFDVCLSADGTVLATGTFEGLSTWDVRVETRIQRFATEYNGFRHSPLIALSEDGSVIATGGYETVNIENLRDGSNRSIPLHLPKDSRVRGIAVNRQGSQVAVSSSHWVRLFDLDGNETAKFESNDQVGNLRFSPDGKQLATIAEDGIEILNSTTLKRTYLLQPTRLAACLAYSPDGRWLVAGTQDGYVFLWNAVNGDLVRVASAPGRWRPPWPLPVALLLVWFACYRWLAKRKFARDKLQVPA